MKLKPIKIKYTETVPKSPIKHIKELIGFLIVITEAPNNKAIKLSIYKNSVLNPLFNKSKTTNIWLFIFTLNI